VQEIRENRVQYVLPHKFPIHVLYDARRPEENLDTKTSFNCLDPVATMREFREYFARSYESHHKIAARVGVRQSTISD
jgi:hypothetical protein